MNWLTIEEIRRLMGWTRGYALKRASLDGWARRGTKPQQYSAESIIDTPQQVNDNRVSKRYS